MTRAAHDPARAPKRDWRRVHHSPWFWVGVAMFMAAILTYVFSEDLSLRPRPHGTAQAAPDRALSLFDQLSGSSFVRIAPEPLRRRLDLRP
jgi:hypothetical protein